MARRRYATKPVGAAPKASSPPVPKSMRSNKRSGTRLEITLSRLLRKKLRPSALPGRPDFVYENAKLAVFAHGCFWHRCPRDRYQLPRTHRLFWKRKLERNVERDRLNRVELEAMGWRVVEVWEHEVREDPAAVAQKIRGLAKQRM